MDKVRNIIEALEDWISGLLIAGGLLTLLVQVIMRYLLHLPTTWHDEIARYLIIWGVLIGSSVAIRDNQHIQVDILYKVFPKSWQRWINFFANLVTMFFFIFMIYYGVLLVEEKMTSGQKSTGEFPLWFIYLILPLSGIMMAVRTLVKLVQIILRKDEIEDEQETLYQ